MEEFSAQPEEELIVSHNASWNFVKMANIL